MATYEYKCPDCYIQYEVTRPIHEDADDPICYNCDAQMRKVFSSPAINLVGGGFYRNGG